MMKKILSIVLAVVMVVGIIAPAFAAGYTDVSAAAQVGPIEKLSALGILTGYADDTFRPENSITRAEMAAVIVRALGLGLLARVITTPPGFADVTSAYDWAYGYITLASTRGIIKGDPDGKFRPGDRVTYAETITMLLRGGRWDQACSLTPWPTGFVAKATELGLTAGVAFDATAFANRGAVAVMTYNALSMPLARWNTSANAYMSDTISFGSFYLDAEEKTVTVTSVPCVNPALKDGQVITVDGTISVPSDVKTDGLLGQDVTVIRVRGDRYAYVKVSTASDRILSGTCVTSQASTIVLNDGGADVKKDVAAGASYYRDKALAGWGDLIPGDALTLILDATGKVRFALANYSVATPVEQPSPKVAGEVTAVSLTARGEGVLVIGGVSYVISPAAFDAHAVTLDASELQLDQISKLISYNVVLTLNSDGRATVVKGAAAILIGAMTKVDSANSKITVSVAGVSREYECICTVPAGLSDSDRIKRVVMTQRADGKITRLDYLVPTNGGVVRAIDPVAKTITLGIGRPPTLNSVVTYTDGTVGTRYWTSGDVSVISVGDQITVWSTVRGGVVKYFEISPMVK